MSIADTTGTLAENVAKIRFDFTDNENGATAYREIDVFGSAAAGLAAVRRFRRAA